MYCRLFKYLVRFLLLLSEALVVRIAYVDIYVSVFVLVHATIVCFLQASLIVSSFRGASGKGF